MKIVTALGVLAGIAALVAGFGLAALLTGCASDAGRAYTPSERLAFTHAVIGQSLDVITTSYGLHDDPDLAEGNPVYWDPEDTGSILACKIMTMGVSGLVGWAWPSTRKWLWWGNAGLGYAAGAWNGYTILSED